MDDVILAHKPKQFNVAARQLMEVQPTRSLRLGYKRRLAGQWTHVHLRDYFLGAAVWAY